MVNMFIIARRALILGHHVTNRLFHKNRTRMFAALWTQAPLDARRASILSSLSPRL
jgi:hypothetical protein